MENLRFELEAEGLASFNNFREAFELPREHDLILERIKLLAKIARRIGGDLNLWGQCAPRLPEDLELTCSDYEQAAERLARLSGWVRVARSLRLPGGATLASCFAQVPGYSPGYWGNPIIPVEKSPQRLAAWAWKVHARASQILEPYGWAPSKAAIKAAVISHGLRRVGRVAVQVAAASLPVLVGGGLRCCAAFGHNSPDCLPGLRQARTVLITARGWAEFSRLPADVRATAAELVRDCDVPVRQAWLEAVELYASSPEEDDAWCYPGKILSTLHGCEILRSWRRELYGQSVGRFIIARTGDNKAIEIVRKGERTYHGIFLGWSTPKEQVREAIAAWRLQEETSKLATVAEAQVLASCQPQGPATVIVRFDDSLRAGNCAAGTRNWGDDLGYKYAIPFAVAARFADYDRVRNTLSVVAREMGVGL